MRTARQTEPRRRSRRAPETVGAAAVGADGVVSADDLPF